MTDEPNEDKALRLAEQAIQPEEKKTIGQITGVDATIASVGAQVQTLLDQQWIQYQELHDKYLVLQVKYESLQKKHTILKKGFTEYMDKDGVIEEETKDDVA